MPARRRQPDPPQIQIRQFRTPDEIDLAVRRLRRRLEELRALDPREVHYEDHRVRNVEHNIRTTILEIFGLNSPEYRQHEYHRIWHGIEYVDMADEHVQQCFADGIPQTFTMLEGLIGRLEERRAEMGQDTATRMWAAFEGLELHPRIAAVTDELYRNGHYRNAVLDAAVALVNFVKEKSCRHDLDGAPLMRTVFSRNNPILAFNDLRDQSDLDEQEGMMHLFEGAVLALRNPRAHTLSDDSPEQALEYIAFLSLLAKQVERAQRRTDG